MFICPTCQREFTKEEYIQKHFLNCWKEKNPNHKSQPAPHSDDIITREVDNGVLDFFASFQKEK